MEDWVEDWRTGGGTAAAVMPCPGYATSSGSMYGGVQGTDKCI